MKREESKIYDECHRMLYFTALRILNDNYEAEEVMHDTLLKFFKKRPTLSTTQERDAWMRRVCINLSIDVLRKKKKVDFEKINELVMGEADMGSGITEYDTDTYSFNGISVQKVKEEVGKLAPGYRIILSLFLFEGYDYEEISEIMNIEESTVRSQYLRGRLRLIKNISNG